MELNSSVVIESSAAGSLGNDSEKGMLLMFVAGVRCWMGDDDHTGRYDDSQKF